MGGGFRVEGLGVRGGPILYSHPLLPLPDKASISPTCASPTLGLFWGRGVRGDMGSHKIMQGLSNRAKNLRGAL